MPLILASGSPRRAELLKMIVLEYQIQPSTVEEELPVGAQPADLVSSLALAKAWDVADTLAEGLVIGADTIVVVENLILGKPANFWEAQNMLSQLSGQKHTVWTGVAVVDAARRVERVAVETTDVYFKKLEPVVIERYIATGEPLDKAGAYGIQGLGSVLIRRIEGCYFNVVGLPLARLTELLSDFGVKVI